MKLFEHFVNKNLDMLPDWFREAITRKRKRKRRRRR
jgi:hypothetical protein